MVRATRHGPDPQNLTELFMESRGIRSRWRLLGAVVLIGLVGGCMSTATRQSSVASSLLRGSPAQIRERLLTHIPVGTTRAEAQRIAVSLGLEPAPERSLGPEAADSIHFRHQGKHGWFGEAIWLIQIECPEGVVKDLFCEQIGTGW